MYRLLAVDMDGTLLKKDKSISEKVNRAVKEAKNKGVKVVLSTGRPMRGIKRYLDELSINGEDDYAVAFNGAMVQKVKTGAEICDRSLEYGDVLRLYRVSRDMGCHMHAMNDKRIITFDKNISRYTVKEAYLNDIQCQYMNIDDLNDDIKINKISFIDEPEILDRVYAGFDKSIYNEYSVSRVTPSYLEVSHIKANKGNGVMAVCERLGIDRKDVICIGDSENDISMIKYAGLGVAMGNAMDNVKEAASYIAPSNEEDGVAEVIKKFILY